MLAVFPGQHHFLIDIFRLHGSRGDHQDDGLAGVDGVDDLLPPLLRPVDAPLIDPSRHPRRPQALHKLHDLRPIVARVADHHVRPQHPVGSAQLFTHV